MRPCEEADFDTIWTIINDGANAYRGKIPQDCLRDPYMSREELRHELSAGVQFWGCESDGALLGVMGLQQVQDVTLIRHAYVGSGHQQRGIGSTMLSHLKNMTENPVLIGTWADASWAIRFYQRHGFRLVEQEEKDRLLAKYWRISPRQREVSVVLADDRFRNQG